MICAAADACAPLILLLSPLLRRRYDAMRRYFSLLLMPLLRLRFAAIRHYADAADFATPFR